VGLRSDAGFLEPPAERQTVVEKEEGVNTAGYHEIILICGLSGQFEDCVTFFLQY